MHKWMMASALLQVAVALPVAAQTNYDKVEITSETLAPGVHVLFGAGGNIGVSTGADATVIIDDQFAPLTPKIVAATAKLSPHPIKFVINTHWHGDHTGGNENLGKSGAIIVAQDNVRTRMASDQFIAAMKSTVKASPAIALPVVTFDSTTTLHLNGEDIRAIHVPPAHTDGDSIIVFTKANVIHMGDTFFAIGYPFVDLSSGGDVRGDVTAADKALALGNATTAQQNTRGDQDRHSGIAQPVAAPRLSHHTHTEGDRYKAQRHAEPVGHRRPDLVHQYQPDDGHADVDAAIGGIGAPGKSDGASVRSQAKTTRLTVACTSHKTLAPCRIQAQTAKQPAISASAAKA